MCFPVPTLIIIAFRSSSVYGAAGTSPPDTDFACVPLAFSVRRRQALPPPGCPVPTRPHPVTACPRKLTLEKRPALRYNSFCKCRCGSMAEHKLPKLVTRVRFPSSARRKTPRNPAGLSFSLEPDFSRRCEKRCAKFRLCRDLPPQYFSSAMTSLISGFLSIMPSSNIQSMVFCHTSSL